MLCRNALSMFERPMEIVLQSLNCERVWKEL